MGEDNVGEKVGKDSASAAEQFDQPFRPFVRMGDEGGCGMSGLVGLRGE